MRILKQSTASTILLGPFVDQTDGFTSETALTISQADVLLWKEGGATLAQKNDVNAAVHRSNGLYTCAINTTDTNTLGILTISVSESGALPVRHDFHVVPANVFDSFMLGTDTLDVQVTGIATNAVTAAAVAADAVTEIQAGLATAAAVALIDDFVDTEVAAIKVVTDKLDSALELDGGVYRYTVNALEQAPSAASNPFILRNNTAQAGASSTITLDAGASATDDLYLYNQIFIYGGTGVGQSRQIADYVGATKVATVAPDWEVPPNNTSTFIISPFGVDAATITDIENAIWDAPRINHAVTGSFGEYVFADVTRVSGNSTPADTLELAYSGGAFTATGWVVPWNPAWDAEVQSEANDAIEANFLNYIFTTAYDPNAKPGSATSLLNVMVENNAGVPRYTTSALSQGGGGGGGGGGAGDGSSFVNIPWNAAWDAEVQSEVTDALTGYGVPTQTQLIDRTLLTAEYASATNAAAIEADTQDIQSRLPATLDTGRIRAKIEQVVDVVLGAGGTGGQSIGGT